MSFLSQSENKFVPWRYVGIFTAVLGVGALSYVGFQAMPENANAAASWANIGGCGGGGGGAAAGAGKWIGRGVSGGLLDAEVLSNMTVGGDYRFNAVNLTLTQHYQGGSHITTNQSLALKSNIFEYEMYAAGSETYERQTRFTGGLGDLGLGVSYNFGNENENSLGLSFSLPTGQHDIKRLHNKANNDFRYMKPFAQPGSGLYGLSASYEYTKDKDWGLIIWGASYSAAFAKGQDDCADMSANKDQAIDSCQARSHSGWTWAPWKLKHQKWGEQDSTSLLWENSYGAPGTGATGQDAISLYAHIGNKEESSTQSVGLTFNIPLSPVYYFEPGEGGGYSGRIRSRDFTVKLSAGLEVTNPNFPLFFAVGIPWAIEDIIDRGKLVEPQNYVGTVGIKGTFL